MNIKEIFQEIFSFPRFVFYNAFGIVEKVPSANRPELVFIDGFTAHWVKRGLSEYLKQNSIPSYLVRMGFQTGHVDRYIEKVAQKIADKNIQKPILVGYSMGGLIAVRYAQKYGWNKINRIITTASPLRGAKATYLLYFLKAARDMNPQSSLIKEMANIKAPKDKLVCIYGQWDQYLSERNATLEGSIKHKLPLGGHSNVQLTKNLEKVFDNYLK